MDTGVGGEEEYDEGDDEHAGPEYEDEEEEEGLYNEDGEVVQGAHAFDDDEDDSEAEADAHGAAAVHRRDAARAALGGKRSAAKKALPSIIQELLGGAGASDEDQDDANESFRPDGDDEDDDEGAWQTSTHPLRAVEPSTRSFAHCFVSLLCCICCAFQTRMTRTASRRKTRAKSPIC